MQLDESTNISIEAHLIAFVHNKEVSDINENILFCKKLEVKTEDNFQVIDSCFTDRPDWKSCSAVRVHSLLGHVKKENPA